ncbi:MAG: hypothetical protein QW590_01940 [Candidatus Bilamarchaeaceae archaeon]
MPVVVGLPKEIKAVEEMATKKEREAAHKRMMETIKKELTTKLGKNLANEIIKKYEHIMKEYWLKGKADAFQPYKWAEIKAGGAAIDFDAERKNIKEELVNEIARMLANRTVISMRVDDKEITLKFSETWMKERNMEFLFTSPGSPATPTLPYLIEKYRKNLQIVDEVEGVVEARQRERNKKYYIVYEVREEKKDGYLYFPEGLTNKESDALTDPSRSKKFLIENSEKYKLFTSADLYPKDEVPGAALMFRNPGTKIIGVTWIAATMEMEGDVVAKK